MTRTRSDVVIVVLQLFTAVTALVGALLLVIRADGSLLSLDPALLDGTPFADWFWPGILLGVLVGLGFLDVGIWHLRLAPGHRMLSLISAVGLIAFLLVEYSMIGFHPLQALYLLVGGAILVLLLVSRVGR